MTTQRPRKHARGDATGGAYERRGKWFARVSIGGGERRSIGLPHCERACDRERLEEGASRCCTDARCASSRGMLLGELVRELREAGQASFIETTIEQLAGAVDEERVAKIAETVRGICAGTLRSKVGASPRPARPASTFTITFKSVREDLTEGRLHKRFPDIVRKIGDEHARDMASRCEKYIEPHIGHLPITAITLDHGLDVLRLIPAHLSQDSRRLIGSDLFRVMKLAVYPLRLVPHNPLPDGFIPKKGKPRAGGFLFPSEERTLLRGRAPDDPDVVAIPLWRRMLYGFLDREGMRKEEAARLQWSDRRAADAGGWIDLERGWVFLEKHKTDGEQEPRDWPLDPGVVEALSRWRRLQPKRARFVFTPTGAEPAFVDHLANTMREDLRAVGITRRELFESTQHRRRWRAHDLRAVFVTVSLVRGKSEAWIRRRTGHTTTAMIERYRRNAENLIEGEGAALTPMVEAIPELAELGEQTANARSTR